jgi:H+/Cl- antiporter ClcA
VDLLKAEPSWLWYLAFVIPLLALVVGVWIVFKYKGVRPPDSIKECKADIVID